VSHMLVLFDLTVSLTMGSGNLVGFISLMLE
jgi:hypothetical protein